ncbi:MAG: CotH kinase family protein [Lachnospiraceae bacterium]|nr:CotH kinase family protein [Lachnospiraceae bacterium]
MSVRVFDDDRMQALLSGLQEAQERPALTFDGYTPAYDAPTGRYFVTQNMRDGAWNGVFTCESGSLYWREDAYFARFAEAVAEGHVFSLYCIDEQNGSYSSYDVVFTGMPLMMIETASGAEIGDELQTAQMRVSDRKFAGKEYQSTNCQVSVRGHSSRGFPKQSYKVVLDRKMSLLGMRRDEDWLLTALYDDDGLIHNKFSYDVWRAIAADNSDPKDGGTTMEYVELFSNNVYMGVYGLTERIDAKELSLGKNDILYKCRGFATPDESIQEDFGLGVDYDVKYPKEQGRDTWMPLKEYLDVFTAGEVKDYDTARELLNMENAIDFNIFIILTRGCDNYVRKNTFFVAEYDRQTGRYVMSKVPWDCNATWGNSLYKGNLDRKLYNASWAYCAWVWSDDIKQMYQCRPEEIQALTLARWKELRQEILSKDRLYGMLDEDFDYLHASGAYDRNYVRWEEHGREHWEDVYIYEYVENRLDFLDAYFEDPYFDEEPLAEEEENNVSSGR